MTYEERKQCVCNGCNIYKKCAYLSRNLQDKCTSLQAVMEGWEYGKEDVIGKACEWIKEHSEWVETEKNGITGWISDEFIEDFRKAMED